MRHEMWKLGGIGTFILAAAVSFWNGAALGAVTLVERSSDISASVTVPSATDSEVDGIDTFASFNSTVSAQAGSTIPSADAQASQISGVTLVGGHLTGADAEGTAEVLVLATPGDTASANAQSQFVMRFTIPAGESYDYTLSGTVGDDGGRASVEVYLDQIAPVEEGKFFINGNGAFSDHGRLGAGTYELVGNAFGAASEVLTGSGLANFSIDFDLTPVPEPTAFAALVALPAGLLARRRR